MDYAKAKECKPEDTFDIRIEEQHGFPYEDSKDNGYTQSRDASPHSLDYGFVSLTKLPIQHPRSLSPPKESSSTSERKQEGKKYFLPIIQIGQLRRLIKLKEAENVRDKQTVFECKEAIDQRTKLILECQERINDIQK